MSGIPNNNQANQNFKNTPVNPNGAILVWDLDKTLVANYFDMVTSIEEPIINTNALRTMNTAMKGNFSANMMLTNNGNLRFIQFVIFLMTKKYNEMFPDEQVAFLFSVIYTAAMNPGGTYKDPRVPDNTVPQSKNDPGYAAKRLEDVRNMCVEGEIPADNLAERVFFFDDLPNHIIRGEINHYIQIQPPFNTVDGDLTDYSPVLVFSERNKQRQRKTRRKNRNERRK